MSQKETAMSHSIPMKRTWQAGLVLVVAMMGISAGRAQTSATQADASFGGANRWVATWGGAPIMPGITTIDGLFQNDHSRSFNNQTVRNIVHISVGGRKVRVRISNAFGQLPLRVGSAHVAPSRGGAAINVAAGRRITFGGQVSTVIPAGAVAISDGVDVNVATATDLAVSVYLPGETEPATFNEFKMQTSYIAPEGSGNLVNAADLP